LLADIEIAKWLNVPLRVLGISSKESLAIVKNARAEGVDIKVSVPFMNLCFTEADIDNFDERFKVMPPLRTQEDKKALLEGLLNGDIDAIFANHTPEDIENKKLEFDYAAIGAATYKGFIPKLFEMFQDEELLKVMDVLSHGNRLFLGMLAGEIQVGQKASITVTSRKAVDHSQSKGSIAYNKLPAVMDQGGLVCTIRGTKINY
jgi:dihydroorotase